MRVLGDDHVTGLVVQRQGLGEFDSSGRRRPVPVDGDEFTLDVDVVIPAIGQTTDVSWIPHRRHPGDTGQHIRGAGRVQHHPPRRLCCGRCGQRPRDGDPGRGARQPGALAVDAWLKTGKLDKPHYETARPDIVQLYNLDEYANAAVRTCPSWP